MMQLHQRPGHGCVTDESDHVVSHGQRDGFELAMDLELAEQILDVVSDRGHADEETIGDLVIARAIGEQTQNLELP
jgi:hypothetical protein